MTLSIDNRLIVVAATCLIALQVPAPSSAQEEPESFSGVGVRLEDHDSGHVLVTGIVVGGSAQEAGVMVGDLILEVDGARTDGWSWSDAVDRIRGRTGSLVSLRIERPGMTRVVEVERRPIDPQEMVLVEWGCQRGDCGSGTGTFVYEDRARFEGEFADGAPEGDGTFYWPDGHVAVGRFSAHEFIGGFVRQPASQDGRMRYHNPDDVYVTATYVNGLAEGSGLVEVDDWRLDVTFRRGRIEDPDAEVLVALLGQPRYGTLASRVEPFFDACDEGRRTCSSSRGVTYGWNDAERVDRVSFQTWAGPDEPIQAWGRDLPIAGLHASTTRRDLESLMGLPTSEDTGEYSTIRRLRYDAATYGVDVDFVLTGALRGVTFRRWTPTSAGALSAAAPELGVVESCVPRIRAQFAREGYVLRDEHRLNVPADRFRDFRLEAPPGRSALVVVVGPAAVSSLMVTVSGRFEGSVSGRQQPEIRAWTGCAVAGARNSSGSPPYSGNILAGGYSGTVRMAVLHFEPVGG